MHLLFLLSEKVYGVNNMASFYPRGDFASGSVGRLYEEAFRNRVRILMLEKRAEKCAKSPILMTLMQIKYYFSSFYLPSLFAVYIAAICSPPRLLFSNTTDIIALDYKTSAAYSVVSGLTRAIAIDVHFSLGYIFWSDVSERNIKRSSTDGSGLTTIISGIGVCDGLAVEWRTSQVFWTDTTSDTISVSDLSGNN